MSIQCITFQDDYVKIFQNVDGEDTIIVACGGDGTVSFLASIICKHNLKASFSAFPLGTGNDFCRSAGLLPLTKNLPEYCRFILKRANRKTIDVWSFNKEVFINYLSLGFDGVVVNYFDRLRNALPRFMNRKKLNFLYYALCGCFVFFFSRRFTGEFSKKELSPSNLKVISLIVSNIDSYSGGKIRMASSSLNDKCLDLSLISNKFELLKAFIKGEVLGSEKHSSFVLKTDKPFFYQIDGEAKHGIAGEYEINWLKSIQFVGA